MRSRSKDIGRPLPWGGSGGRVREDVPPWVPPPATSSPSRYRNPSPPMLKRRRSMSSSRRSASGGSSYMTRGTTPRKGQSQRDEREPRSSRRSRQHHHSHSHHYHDEQHKQQYQHQGGAVSWQDVGSSLTEIRHLIEKKASSRTTPRSELSSRSISPLRPVKTQAQREHQQHHLQQQSERELRKELEALDSALSTHKSSRGHITAPPVTPPMSHSTRFTVSSHKEQMSATQMSATTVEQDEIELSDVDFEDPGLLDFETPAHSELRMSEIKQMIASKRDKGAERKKTSGSLPPSLSKAWKSLISSMVLSLHNSDNLTQFVEPTPEPLPETTLSACLSDILGRTGEQAKVAPEACNSREELVTQLAHMLM
eukprot:TRINITY_DN18168_c0_g1_i1.p1 TRINITY_DN18168_c0_g1~~TRINITY_DN18168_c0_g1_i1.p1  ORF type:complete len:383 (+),score=63.45 TRINITY_DN18168_c0_g1_i1:43-1149(+)